MRPLKGMKRKGKRLLILSVNSSDEREGGVRVNYEKT